MGNFSGISLELVGKSDVFVWECVGNAQGLLGNEWGIDQGLLRIIWETVDIRRGCWKMHWEFVGNSYELFGKPLVFIGNPWRISGDFRLGIHSLGEVQIQNEHILTHAISLTKPRFPFHVLTGFGGGKREVADFLGSAGRNAQGQWGDNRGVQGSKSCRKDEDQG